MTALAQPVHRSSGAAARLVTRVLGELLMTLGVLLLLFVAYQLVWTNVEAQRAQSQVADDIREAWQRPDGSTAPSGGTETAAPAVDFGQGFAFLHVPRLGNGWTVPVLEGVDLEQLARGVGHYPRTAMPGQLGNFSVAGHRATNGEPFAHLDALRPGDVIVTETRGAWLTYVVDSTRIVRPTDTWVIQPVPGKPRAEPTRRLITLTTCHPRWSSEERLIVSGHLVGERARSDGPPPELTRAA